MSDSEIPREVPLAAIDDRVERAKEHLDAIKRGLVAYYETDPCRVVGEFESDKPTGEWKIVLDPLGPRLNTLIGEFLNNLRSALNHLARQLVLENGGIPTEQSQFPIFARAPVSKKD